MIPAEGAGPRLNPFRRQRVDPASFPYLRLDGPPWDDIVGFCRDRRAVQIDGPHGTGKSLLLHRLHADFAAQDPDVRFADLRPRDDPRRGGSIGRVLRDPRARWFLDGGERLIGPERALLRALLRAGAVRAVVTVHDGFGLPSVPRSVPSLELLRFIVAEAERRDGLPPGWVAERWVETAWETADGSIRAALEALYHRCEQILARSPARATAVAATARPVSPVS